MTEITLPNQPARAESQGAAIEQTRAAAEVAAAVSVARNFPRDIDRAGDELGRLTGSLAIAERAFYEVPNRGAGLSVHIARELTRIWGNVDYGVRELRRDDSAGVSEMQAWAWDQETNVRSTRSFIQPHEKSLKGGRRSKLTDLNDIYLNNQNTAARAVRECIFTILPGWFVAHAEAGLRATLQGGNGASVEERAGKAVALFADLGVVARQLETRVGKGRGKWGPNDLAALTRAYTSITQDGIPVGEFFPEQTVEVPGADVVEDGQQA